MDFDKLFHETIVGVNFPVEQVKYQNGTLFVGWVGISDDPNEMTSDSRLLAMITGFPLVLNKAGWPDDVDQMVVEIYDPSDAINRRENALKITVSREQAYRYDDGDLSEVELAVEVLNETKVVWENGKVEEIDVNVTVTE